MAQAAFAMAVSMPIVLMIMFAIPLDISFAVQTVASFLIFCSFIAVPFFFAGIVVCLSLTKASAPIGRVYFADLMGAAAGCFGSRDSFEPGGRAERRDGRFPRWFF